MNKLKEKILNRERILGTLVSLSDPCHAEIIGNIGYGCVWIDMEHTHMSYKDVLCHLNAARSSDIRSVVRLPQDDLTATKKILEMDPDGVIFPMVRSYDEARRLMEMTLYPPYGTRGFGPLRAIGYGAEDAKEYVEKKSLDLCRFIQIEHINAIDELEKIVGIPYIDGFIFGPNDLSGSLGEMLNVFDGNVLSAVKKAVDILKAHNKYFGFAIGIGEQEIKTWTAFEPDILFTGADWCFMYAKGKETLETAKKYMQKSAGH